MARRGSLRLWPGDKSRMSREAPVRFCEGPGVKLPRATRLVALCNGTRVHALAMREELQSFLHTSLCLTLSMEKTKVTHLNDGINFLGFTLRRCRGRTKVGVKTLISAKARKRHLATLEAATGSSTFDDSVISKIQALNRIIAGWCRY